MNLNRHISDIAPRAEGTAPLMVAWKLNGHRVLVVGGGEVATQRVRSVLSAGARVTVVAVEAGAELHARARRHEIELHQRPFQDRDLTACTMVLTAIDDPDESRRIAGLCRAAGIPVNVADVPPLCDFYFNAILRRGPVRIAVSTGGMGPALAARIRTMIDALLPRNLAAAVERFGVLRKAVRAADPGADGMKRRMRWLRDVGYEEDLDRLAGMSDAEIGQRVRAYLGEHGLHARSAEDGSWNPEGDAGTPGTPLGCDDEKAAAFHAMNRAKQDAAADRLAMQNPRGSVTLVGAGPGDPDLLTVAARSALESADLVLADRLVPAPILALVQGELRVAAKRPGRADRAQDELHRWMLEAARAGRSVVRLKAGDPFLFGRGAEELRFLAEHDIETRVLPGLSSALYAPLAGGISVTERGRSDRVLVLTGHGRAGSRPRLPDYDPDTTYVFLMAMGRLQSLSEELRSRGFPAHLPAACIERAGHEDQRSLSADLATLPARVAEAGMKAPAVIVLGRVAAGVNAVATGAASTPAARLAPHRRAAGA